MVLQWLNKLMILRLVASKPVVQKVVAVRIAKLENVVIPVVAMGAVVTQTTVARWDKLIIQIVYNW